MSGTTAVGGTNPSFGAQGGQEDRNLQETTKDEARSLKEDAKRETSKMAGQAGDYVQGLVEKQKDQAADRLGNVAGALRDVGNRLRDEDGGHLVGKYAANAADQVDRVSRYLHDRDLNSFVRDTENFARRHPDVFLGGTFVAGLLLARFLKSSGDRGYDGYEANEYATYPGGSGRTRHEGQDMAYASYPGERYGRGVDTQGPPEPHRSQEKPGPYGTPEGVRIPKTPGGA